MIESNWVPIKTFMKNYMKIWIRSYRRLRCSWYCHDRNIHYIFKNFDLERINNYKNFENYQWNIIFEIIKDFVKDYPNNTLEFINDEN